MNLGSGIRDPEKTYSGSRIQGSKRHRIPDPQHCKFQLSKRLVNFLLRCYILLQLSNLFASFGVMPIDGVLLPVLDVDILYYEAL
jgi:hypothetical protein